MRKSPVVAATLSVLSICFSSSTSFEHSVSDIPQPSLDSSEILDISKEGLFVETFEEEELFDGKRWVKSSHEKYSSQEVILDEYTVKSGKITSDKGLILDQPAKHYGLAVKLDNPLVITGEQDKKEMVIQYEVKLKNGLSCGGAYLKLIRADRVTQLEDFNDQTPFVIMFGPDKCGSNDKVHFIFQHKNPVSGKYEEKHLKNPPVTKTDRMTHLYTLTVKDDNTFEIFIDQNSVASGSLLDDVTPAVNPPKMINDPKDVKPIDWVEETKIPDPTAVKPEDWDDNAPRSIPDLIAVKPDDWLGDEQPTISDPSVIKPEDWDDEDDGDWIPPQIPNPKCEEVSGCGEWKRPMKPNPNYKGKWQPPMIPNPAYKGVWTPRKIPNPGHFEDNQPARMDPIGALAIEVWTMSDGITFDNFWLGNDIAKAWDFANLTWSPKHQLELEEYETEKEKEREAIKKKKAIEGSIFSKLETIFVDVARYFSANLYAGLAASMAVLISVFLGTFFLCCADSKSAPSDDKKKDDEVDLNTAKDTKDSTKSKLRQRKKAPIAN